MTLRLLRLALAVLALSGCAASSSGVSSSRSGPPVRCLADPSERDTRPLFFLFCVQGQ
jgi:hypothetical protein